MRILRKIWFPALLLAVLVLGALEPGPGQRLAGQTGSLLVVVLFLMSLTLPFRRLREAATNTKAIGLSAAISWIVLPALCWFVARWVWPEDRETAIGFLLLGVLPTTLASAAVWTRIAGGNEAVPLVFTAVSNALAFVVVPVLLLLTVSRWQPVDAEAMGIALTLKVLAPVVAGQIVRALIPNLADRLTVPIGVVARLLVIAIVLAAASRASASFRTASGMIAGIFAVATGIHAVALLLCAGLCRLARVPAGDRIGVLFGGSQKSLYVGVWLAAAFYPDLPGALLPMLAYHVMQLFCDTALAEWMRSHAQDAVEIHHSPPTH